MPRQVGDVGALYQKVRTYFLKAQGHSTSERSDATRGDRSADIAASRRPAALTWTMTNADQPEQPRPKAKLNGNQGVIYQSTG